MRKFLFVFAAALLGVVGLSACSSNNHANTGATSTASTQAKLSKPSSPTDIKAWQAYLSQVVEDNRGKITNTPFVYFVPAVSPSVAAAATSAGPTSASVALASTSAQPANASSAAAALGRVQSQLNDVVASTVLPGNLIAVGGPDSKTTAEVLETAFKSASKGSFKGVDILFIGDQAQEAAVKQAIAPSGATFKFVQM